MKSEESSRYRKPMPDSAWSQTMERLKTELTRLDPAVVKSLTTEILQGIEFLDEFMDRCCRETCPSCDDPCCSGRRVFFNQSDMLYLAASDGEIPNGQTRTASSEACRYLAQYGCRLPRAKRPYVCVWFLCEPQMRLFEREPARFQRTLIKKFETIRSSRLMLEYLYESALSAPGP